MKKKICGLRQSSSYYQEWLGDGLGAVMSLDRSCHCSVLLWACTEFYLILPKPSRTTHTPHRPVKAFQVHSHHVVTPSLPCMS